MKANAPKRKVFQDAVDLLTDEMPAMQTVTEDSICMLRADSIRPFEGSPFRLYEGERMAEMAENVKDHGILNPVIVQELPDGYRMLSGHNRLEAAKRAGIDEIPAIVKKDLTEQEAWVYVIETNMLQRSFVELSTSEKAAVLAERYDKVLYARCKDEIIRELRQLEGIPEEADPAENAGHDDLHSDGGAGRQNRDRIGEEYGLSGSSVARLLRVNQLIPELKKKLDDGDLNLTAEILRPKVVIAENVSGLLKGNAKGYVNELLKAFRSAGYVTQIFQLDAHTMGVPQRRRRVFFIAHRNDLDWPKLRLDFHEKPIKFGEVRTDHGIPFSKPMMAELIGKRKEGDQSFADISMRERGKFSMFNDIIVSDDRVAPTNTACAVITRFYDGMKYSDHDYIATQTFPEDYDFMDQSVIYVCGMSVPPVMMAQISSAVYEQWLK